MSRQPLTCSRCPKWKMSTCIFRGVVMVAEHPICDHGRKFIKNEASRLWMAAKRKAGK